MNGLAGSDTYVYSTGDGNDFIDEQSSGTDYDTLKLNGLNQTDIRFEQPSGDPTDVVIRIIATGETITLDNQFDKEDGVEQIVFSDGTILGGDDWSLDGILRNLAVIYGTPGADTLDGTGGNDVFIGGTGDDTINGGKTSLSLYRRHPLSVIVSLPSTNTSLKASRRRRNSPRSGYGPTTMNGPIWASAASHPHRN